MSRPFHFMTQALLEAHKAFDKEEVPVGALIVREGKIIAAAHNNCITGLDPTAHAEILALRQAAKIRQTIRLEDCDMYVTLEPCAMCAQALAHARIRCLYFGAYDPKGGGVEHGARVFSHSTCHHRPEIIGGIYEEECGEILVDFFRRKRASDLT